MFAVMNVYTGDQSKLTLQIAEWCHNLEDFPISLPACKLFKLNQSGRARSNVQTSLALHP
jgi:hypothetical protein